MRAEHSNVLAADQVTPTCSGLQVPWEQICNPYWRCLESEALQNQTVFLLPFGKVTWCMPDSYEIAAEGLNLHLAAKYRNVFAVKDINIQVETVKTINTLILVEIQFCSQMNFGMKFFFF